MTRCFFDALEHAFGRLFGALGVLVALSIGSFVLAITADLFLRHYGIGNIPWLNEVLEYLLYAGVFLAAPWVLRQGAHVRVDIVFSIVSEPWALRLQKAVDALSAVISGTLCYYGTAAALDAHAFGAKQYKTLTVDTWWLLAIFAAATFLLTVEFLFRLRRPPQTAPPADAANDPEEG